MDKMLHQLYKCCKIYVAIDQICCSDISVRKVSQTHGIVEKWKPSIHLNK